MLWNGGSRQNRKMIVSWTVTCRYTLPLSKSFTLLMTSLMTIIWSSLGGAVKFSFARKRLVLCFQSGFWDRSSVLNYNHATSSVTSSSGFVHQFCRFIYYFTRSISQHSDTINLVFVPLKHPPWFQKFRSEF